MKNDRYLFTCCRKRTPPNRNALSNFQHKDFLMNINFFRSLQSVLRSKLAIKSTEESHNNNKHMKANTRTYRANARESFSRIFSRSSNANFEKIQTVNYFYVVLKFM